MAKKSETEPEKKRGRKQVECPTCKKPTATRAGKCAECGTPKPTAATKKSKKGGTPLLDLIELNHRIAKVNDMGGLSAVKKKIAAVANAVEALSELGGVEGAEATLAALEALESIKK